MDDTRMMDKVCTAVDQRCRMLQPDAHLARRVMYMANEKGEMNVKRKLSLGLILLAALLLATLTALAALLSGMELVEQEAVPLALGNDLETRRVDVFSNEELQQMILLASENGIILNENSSVMCALRNGDGYYEEEVIMAICREAFGGLYYEWTVEQRHWYGDVMVAIGFAAHNDVPLPGKGELPPKQARQLALVTLHNAYGADIPLTDRSMYRPIEDFVDGQWEFHFYPRDLYHPVFHITFDAHGQYVEHSIETYPMDTYSETELMDRITTVYAYRTYSMDSWGLDAWHVFGQLLPGAMHTSAWSAEYDGYLASTYLLPEEGDIPRETAVSIALAATGTDAYLNSCCMLLGSGDQRIWKVTLACSDPDGTRQQHSVEMDSRTGEVLRCITIGSDMLPWCKYMLHSTYESVSAGSTLLTQHDALELAVSALHLELGNDTIPFHDPVHYTVTCRHAERLQRYTFIFTPLSLNYGRCSIDVNTADGTTDVNFASAPGYDGDTLHQRYVDVYGSALHWDQSLWVTFDQHMDDMIPTTFEGKLFKQTTYPEESSVAISRDKALDIAYADVPPGDDHICILLIDAEPNPVWKIRMSTFPMNTLYEIDAMTGEIVDKEFYVCQNPDFDHNMKMFTLRRDYMPAALEEFGPVRIAMELTVKACPEYFGWDETLLMNEALYSATVDGMTVTFTSLTDEPSWRVTILDNGLDASIKRLDK